MFSVAEKVKKFFSKQNVWISELIEIYGQEFVAILGLEYVLMKGCQNGWLRTLQLPYFKRIGVQAESYQLYRTLGNIPWSLKPLFGLISDLYPLGGFNKRYYLIFSILLLGLPGWFALGDFCF